MEGPSAEQAAVFAAAAGGNLGAQREMVRVALESWGGDDRLYYEALKFAEFWARCCVLNGDLTDYGHLLSVLGLLTDFHEECGNMDFCKAYAAEGLAILDMLADAGIERAGNDLNELVSAMPADAVEHAKKLREIMA